MRIFQRQQKRQSDQGTYAFDLFQQLHLRIIAFGQRCDAIVVLGDALTYGLDLGQ
jgi:hypothetical protein